MHSFAFPRITRKEQDETRSTSVGRSGAIPFICACQQRAYVGVELRIADFFLEILLEQRAGDVMPAVLLSNCTWEDGDVVATFRQPFDILVETVASATRIEAGESARSAKSEIWLGDLDSNQGCPGQSREFYR